MYIGETIWQPWEDKLTGKKESPANDNFVDATGVPSNPSNKNLLNIPIRLRQETKSQYSISYVYIY